MDRPKLLGDVTALELRLSQVNDQHIAPITAFVERLRERMGQVRQFRLLTRGMAVFTRRCSFCWRLPVPKQEIQASFL